MVTEFDYTKEDIDFLITSMALEGKEPVNSMGNDTPLAVISDKPQRLFAYFRQLFAQVTNPPIDPIREELVMSMTNYVGSIHTNLLEPAPAQRIVRSSCWSDAIGASPHQQIVNYIVCR